MLCRIELHYMETKRLGEDYFFPRDFPVLSNKTCTARHALVAEWASLKKEVPFALVLHTIKILQSA